MNVRELHELLTAALAQGLDPETTVVIGTDAGFTSWSIIDKVIDPSHSDDYIWLTLMTGREADARRDEGHYTFTD